MEVKHADFGDKPLIFQGPVPQRVRVFHGKFQGNPPMAPMPPGNKAINWGLLMDNACEGAAFWGYP